MKKLFALCLTALMLLAAPAASAAETMPDNDSIRDETMLIIPIMSAQNPQTAGGDIEILHTNDVHCAYGAYDRVAALAKDADLLVDVGDALQGDAIGTLSEGGIIVEIMNEVGYDLAIPGNHEFDYGMERFLELAEAAEFPYVSANFLNEAGEPVLAPYEILEAEGKRIAFVGLCTPETFTKSSPVHFRNEAGEYIYDFCRGEGELYAAAQAAIDAARAEGADYVIGLCHLGVRTVTPAWTATAVIAHTRGFDAVLDGHSHHIVSEWVEDAAGKSVLLAQTGTKLASVGRLTITADGRLSHENIDPAAVEPDAETTAFLTELTARFEELQNEVVARSEVELTILNPDGTRAVRSKETNLGDLCADAYRVVMGADVGFVNGGGIRTGISAGDVTRGDIIAVHPFGNEMCLAEVTGQQLLDCLELGARGLPNESGGFQHVSGMAYTVDTTIPSSVVLDEAGLFVSVAGAYRVKDVTVGGEPLDVDRTYTLASHNYLLKEQGSGAAMFGTENIDLLQDCVMLDNQLLIRYITEHLGGVIGREYAEPQGRITVLTAEAEEALPTMPEQPAETGPAEATYTVVSGDCLWNIAQRVYGSGAKYPVIAAANGLADPNYIRVGQVLTLPAA